MSWMERSGRSLELAKQTFLKMSSKFALLSTYISQQAIPLVERHFGIPGYSRKREKVSRGSYDLRNNYLDITQPPPQGWRQHTYSSSYLECGKGIIEEFGSHYYTYDTCIGGNQSCSTLQERRLS